MRKLLLAAVAAAIPTLALADPQHPMQAEAPDFHAIALQQEMRAANAELRVLQLQNAVVALQKQIAVAKAAHGPAMSVSPAP